jgi:hypothetical protein
VTTAITWGGLTSITAGASIDSDPIALPAGTIGFSATVFMLGGSPNGIAGNLQIAVSNGGPFLVLPGLLAVSVSNGLTVPFPFSFPNAYYTAALLRWTQSGPYKAGTLFDGDWNVVVVPPPGPTPTPPLPPTPPSAASFAQPSLSQAPACAAQLTGYFNPLFANRWVQPPGNA